VADGRDPAVELVHQLYEGRLLWPTWLRARRARRDLLCPKRPILIAHDVAGRRGIFGQKPEPEYASDNPTYHHHVRRSWAAVDRARSRADLFRPFRVRETGQVAALEVGQPSRAIDKTRSAWVGLFRHVRTEMNLPNGTVMQRDAEAALIDRTARRFAELVDAEIPGQPPPTSVRWDASIKVMAVLAVRSLRTKESYNPLKNVNDSFDFDLLRYLAEPAAICTRDRRLIATVAGAKSWQAKWIVNPDTLATPQGRASLIDLRWSDDLQREGS
jgi:hypothetical protein